MIPVFPSAASPLHFGHHTLSVVKGTTMPTLGSPLTSIWLKRQVLVFDLRILGRARFRACNKLGNLVQSETLWEFEVLQTIDDYWQKSSQRAEATEVPAAAKTMDISSPAKERKHFTTTGSNCVPLDSESRRMASW